MHVIDTLFLNKCLLYIYRCCIVPFPVLIICVSLSTNNNNNKNNDNNNKNNDNNCYLQGDNFVVLLHSIFNCIVIYIDVYMIYRVTIHISMSH